MFECMNCLNKSVIWDSDFDFSDYGYEGEGIVHVCHCTNYHSEIEYRVPLNTYNESDEDSIK